MLQWLKKRLTPSMIRPLIYKVFVRGLLALCAAQLIHFFVPASWPLTLFANLALIWGVLFLLFAFMAWLRMDGMRIPQFRLPRIKRKDPAFLISDIADHIDDEIVQFDDLDKEQQDACVYLADLILAVLCLILSAIV